jgi:hypothetical protein
MRSASTTEIAIELLLALGYGLQELRAAEERDASTAELRNLDDEIAKLHRLLERSAAKLADEEHYEQIG